MADAQTPAILGGAPVRDRPYPLPNTIGPAERALVNEVLDSGLLSAFVAHDGEFFNGGKMVRALEEEFCRLFGSRHAISVNSATSGLHAAVVAALCGPGDEVIVPPYTMSATATAVTMANATPVFADIREDTFCLDVEQVRRCLSPRTRAIIAVNLFGNVADLLELRRIADERGLYLIEDNAQGPGARLDGRFAGTIGHLGIFSLNCHKTVQCGEGGVVVTDDPKLADRVRLVRNHGEVVQALRGEPPDELRGLIGFNYRLTELQAAVGLAQIRRLEELTVDRIRVAGALTAGLAELPGLVAPHVESRVRHVYYAYVMKVKADQLGLSRAQLAAALDAEGLAVQEGYVRPIYLYPMYDRRVGAQRTGMGAGIWHPPEGSPVRYQRGLCPVTERMHFEELLITSLFRTELHLALAEEFLRGLRKILAHREAVRARLVERGVR